MHPMDKKEKHFHNYAYVTKNTGNFWAKRFLDELFSINHIGITKVPRLKYESVKSVYSNVKKKKITTIRLRWNFISNSKTSINGCP